MGLKPTFFNTADHPDLSIEKRLVLVKTINSNCEEPLRDSLAAKVKQRDAEDQVACIIYDSIMYCAEAVADHLKFPCLNFRTVAASIALLYDSLPMLTAAGHIPHPGMCLRVSTSQVIVQYIDKKKLMQVLHQDDNESPATFG